MREYNFDAEKTKNELINWIKEYFAHNGPDAKAVIGISGGKDSTIAAALCIEALGADRVVGVRMPEGIQRDIDVARNVCETLGIESYEINIGLTMEHLTREIPQELFTKDNINIYYCNTPARIRMTTLYGIAALVGGRVVNTCNLSEDYVGYSTKYGDLAGDFSLFGRLTATEVIAIGDAMGLPAEWVHKVPEDGLSGKSDEDNLGFSYETLDAYLREYKYPDAKILASITNKHKAAMHKECLCIPTFPRCDFEF